jgi:choline-sulfatase
MATTHEVQSSDRMRAAPALRAVAALAVLASLASAAGCDKLRGAVSAQKPNVLLVTLDTTRADHTSAYGYPRPTTPRLEGLLPTSVKLETAYAPTATTLPSHASMFTALHPRSHGVLKNGQKLAEGIPTLAGALAGAGYRTAGFVSSYVLDARFGPQQGFATWDDDFGERPCKMLGKRWEGRNLDESFCRRGAETRDRAIAWLEGNGYLGTPPAGAPASGDAEGERKPFFLFVHFFDPHDPYVPEPEHAALFPPLGEKPDHIAQQRAAYDGELHYTDAQLGALLDRLAAAGILDDTLVLVTADHGEGLGDHGWMNHGLYIYDEAVRVPWIVRWPGHLPGGRVIAEPVELVDMPSTVLDLVGIPDERLRGEGRSLADALRGKGKLDADRPVYLQRRLYEGKVRGDVEAHGEKIGIRVGRWKYIEAKEEATRELYDLATDPGELANLVEQHPGDASRLAASLGSWAARTPTAGSGGGVSDEEAEKLRALGYVQ